MGTPTARATHLGLSILGAVLYVVFLIPRWWVLTGDIPATLGTAGRIAVGVPIAAAAVPVMLNLQRSVNAEPKTPEPALRLRAWSAVLHVVAGILMIAAAVAEIWLSLRTAGPWLFAVYGAAGAIAALAVLAFALSFVAEKPPKVKPPKANKSKSNKSKSKKSKAEKSKPSAPSSDTAAEETAAEETAAETIETIETLEAIEPQPSDPDDQPQPTESAAATELAPALLNKRPAGKRHRLRR